MTSPAATPRSAPVLPGQVSPPEFALSDLLLATFMERREALQQVDGLGLDEEAYAFVLGDAVVQQHPFHQRARGAGGDRILSKDWHEPLPALFYTG